MAQKNEERIFIPVQREYKSKSGLCRGAITITHQCCSECLVARKLRETGVSLPSLSFWSFSVNWSAKCRPVRPKNRKEQKEQDMTVKISSCAGKGFMDIIWSVMGSSEDSGDRDVGSVLAVMIGIGE